MKSKTNVAALLSLADRVRETEMNILVWGPDPKSKAYSEGAKKRAALREHLSDHFGTGSIHFSEDDTFEPVNEQFDEEYSEFLQARWCDAAVVVAEGMSPLVELSLYHQELRHKCIVFARRSYIEGPGFAKHSYLNKGFEVVPVEDSEWSTCRRIREKALEFTRNLQMVKFRYGAIA